jgi:hypothetical protein
MTTDALPPSPTDDCARFDAQLGPWLEHDLDPAADRWMGQHRDSCAACAAIARELDTLVAEAGALPALAPPHDLWPVIESRLAAPVIPIGPRGDTAITSAPGRTITIRRFALAATLLVAVSSGVTWQLARRAAPGSGTADTRVTAVAAASMPTRDASANTADDTPADVTPGATTELVIGTPTPAAAGAPRARFVSDDEDVHNAGVTFEREIIALRLIVDERFTELDTATVRELRRNLDIINRAIAESRAALARDPRSVLVSSQLDRALQAKLDLLRRVALL